MDEYESVLLVKPEVFVYKIPPRTTNRGYRASDWKLESPDWTGKMQVVAKGKTCIIKLLDKNTGELFSKSPIDKYPGVALESVMDSSRYFVLRIESDSGQSAFIGIGFADRGDSFDLNVALQDHFKWLQKSEEIEQETTSDKPALDLGFKDGQTITINMNLAKKAGNSAKPRPKPMSAGATPGFLPPPPSGIKLPPPSTRVGSQSASTTRENPSNNQSATSDFLVDLAFASPASTQDVSSTTSESQSFTSSDVWGDFAAAAAPANSSEATQSNSSQNWIDF